MDLDVAAVRSAFPALTMGLAYFDGPGGSQVPAGVAAAVAEALTGGLANRGTVTTGEQRADGVVLAARTAVADLLGCVAEGVVFGRSMTQLTYDVARALSKQWTQSAEVVVTRLDHDANIRPWVQAAHSVGARVRWADFDRETGDLPVSAVEKVLNDQTAVVAVTGASNLIGTRPDVAGIAAAAHSAGALVYVDGVHLTPHTAIEVASIGADFFACSPYKFFGPHLGVVVADPALWSGVDADKLLPSADVVPERFELGTLPYELLAGVTATVDFVAGMVGGSGTRRERVVASMTAVERHEDELFTRLLGGLRDLSAVRLHGEPARRTPTALFSVADRSPLEIYQGLAARKVNAPAGSFYAIEASRWLGLGDGGAVRAGLAPYTTDADVDRLLTGVADLCR